MVKLYVVYETFYQQRQKSTYSFSSWPSFPAVNCLKMRSNAAAKVEIKINSKLSYITIISGRLMSHVVWDVKRQ